MSAEKSKDDAGKLKLKEMYAAMKVSAEALQAPNSAVQLLGEREVKKGLTTMVEDLARVLDKVAGISSMIGSVGLALASDSSTTKELEELSRQTKECEEEIQQRLKTLKMEVRINEVLKHFLALKDQMLPVAERSEGIFASDREKLGSLVEIYPPKKIVQDLNKVHNLITGEVGGCKPLFDQLAEEGDRFEGVETDLYLSVLFLQFQMVLALEIRTVRMLHLFIPYEEDVVSLSDGLKGIFQNLVLQRKYDPTLSFEWYLKFRASGGEMLMSTVRWPRKFIYLPEVNEYVRGIEEHPGDRGVFRIKLHEGKYRITVKSWPDFHLYLAHGTRGYVMSCKGDPGPQGYWNFAIKNIRERAFVLTTERWPNWHVVMENNPKGWLSGCNRKANSEGHIKLTACYK